MVNDSARWQPAHQTAPRGAQRTTLDFGTWCQHSTSPHGANTRFRHVVATSAQHSTTWHNTPPRGHQRTTLDFATWCQHSLLPRGHQRTTLDSATWQPAHNTRFRYMVPTLDFATTPLMVRPCVVVAFFSILQRSIANVCQEKTTKHWCEKHAHLLFFWHLTVHLGRQTFLDKMAVKQCAAQGIALVHSNL